METPPARVLGAQEGKELARQRHPGGKCLSASSCTHVFSAKWSFLVRTSAPLLTESKEARGLPGPVLPGAMQATGIANVWGSAAPPPSAAGAAGWASDREAPGPSGALGPDQVETSLGGAGRILGAPSGESAWGLRQAVAWALCLLPACASLLPTCPHLSVKPSCECLYLMPSEPHSFTVTSAPFLELFRLFQVVGKIDDTLALLNLVSFSFGSWAGAPPARSQGRCSTPGVQGWPPATLSCAPPPSQACMMTITFLPFTVSHRGFWPPFHPGPSRPPLTREHALLKALRPMGRCPGPLGCRGFQEPAGSRHGAQVGVGVGGSPRPPGQPGLIPAGDPPSSHPAAPGFGGRAML